MTDYKVERRGRPRLAGAEAAILQAVVVLVRLHGIDGVTTQMVADAAGVGRQTIYRRWAGREEMLFEALIDEASRLIHVPMDDVAPARQIEVMCDRLFTAMRENGRFTRDLLALIREDSNAQARFREEIVEPWMVAIVQTLRQAAPDSQADLRMFAFTLQSGLVYHLQLGGALDEALQQRCCGFIRAGLGLAPA